MIIRGKVHESYILPEAHHNIQQQQLPQIAQEDQLQQSFIAHTNLPYPLANNKNNNMAIAECVLQLNYHSVHHVNASEIKCSAVEEEPIPRVL